jgi:uncharacterized protein YbbC (DUF1343 family)
VDDTDREFHLPHILAGKRTAAQYPFSMALQIGLDHLQQGEFHQIKGKSIAVVCNQASVDSSFRHILACLEPGHSKGLFKIQAVFGPQHGLFGTTQDNMIEWQGEGAEKVRFPVYSLYGEHREPTDEMLKDVELVLIDLPDVGARYYTFIWTMSLMMKAAERNNIPVIILDRPNPIGSTTEGPMLDPDYRSFVGLYPVPMRHGLTIAEVARYVQAEFHPKSKIEVVPLTGWDPFRFADETSYAWVMPSPNMPTVDTAVVYPGACLLEGTNMSEGRGTTKPFEMVGAPWIDADRLARDLNQSGLDGATFRPVQFEPTFNKYKGKICNGVFVHVLDRTRFESTMVYMRLLQCVIHQTGVLDASHVKLDRFIATSGETELPGFAWKQPPYEYEFTKLPIDILLGHGSLRKNIEEGCDLKMLRKDWKEIHESFHHKIKNRTLYNR